MNLKRIIPALLLSSLPAGAGVVFEIEVKDHEQSPPRTSEMEIRVEGRNIAIPISSSDGTKKEGKMIYRERGGKKEVVVTDDKTKSYYVMDKATTQSIAGKVKEGQKQLRDALKNVPQDPLKNLPPEALKNLPPEVRKRLEQARKQIEALRKQPEGVQPAAPKAELKRTGERATKNGYPCVKYDVFRGGKKVRELWITDWSNIEGGKEAAGSFKEMAKFFEEIMDAIPGGAGPDAGDTWQDQGFEYGFPVVNKEFDEEDGSLEDESNLRSARRRTLAPDAFEPPSGYKRRTMFPGN